MYKLYNEINFNLISKALEVHSIIILGFLVFTLFTSNPFQQLEFTPQDGLGFNPVLQDPALAIHPPLLYVGYVGFSAVFSLSIATMRLNDVGSIPWYKYMKFFVTIAWAFLTVGISFGSIWAYYELGWGGWWFWDPVENAALMPWLIGTALFHSLITVEKKKSLQAWVLLLAIISFLLSIIGTFLVRSGILTSVHTFALDPERGIYILIFILLVGSYSLIIFALNSKKFFNQQFFYFFSREGAILANNILMIVVCLTIFFGTTYPLFVEIFTNNRISVGEPYFNSTIIPMMIPAFLIMGVGPILTWGKENFNKTILKTLPSIFITFFCVFFLVLFFKLNNFFGIIGITLSSWIIINIIVIEIIKKNKKNILKQSYSMIIAHLGIALIILGITGSSIWQKENILRMKINESINFQNYQISFNKIEEIKGYNYLALRGSFYVYDLNNEMITILEPENRFYNVTKNSTTEASIHTNLIRDLYIVMGEGNFDDGWVVRMYYNPLVIWIWIGVFVTFIGGILAIYKNNRNLYSLNR